jgi:hypothetical protein
VAGGSALARRAGLLALAIALGGCAGSPAATGSAPPPVTSSPAATPTPSPGATPTAVATASPTVAPSGSATADQRCLKSIAGLPHQARELEALLPKTVAGRQLSVWSVRGRCWLITSGIPAAAIDELLTTVDKTADPPFDIDHLTYGIAGRSDTSKDPPYFVYAAARTDNADEIDLASWLMFGGATFKDPIGAGNLALYDEQTIAGHEVWVGTEDMLGQSVHQRGRPYLYQNETTMYLVITDDEAWAADAIGQLP